MPEWTSKNGGTEPENQGPEAQSARAGGRDALSHFPEKLKKIKENASISVSFFAPFLHLFRNFSGKAEKEVQGPAPGP